MSLEIVRTIRQKYPTPLGALHGDFLEELAVALGLGLVQKNWGTYVLTREGVGVSQDCLMAHGGYHWDVLQDGEGAAKAAWDLVLDDHGDPLILPESRYVAPRSRPASPGGGTGAPPTLPPPPPAFDAQAACERLEKALTEALGVIAARFEVLEDELADQSAQVEDLDGRLSAPQQVKAVGATNTVWTRPFAHAHPFELEFTLEGK